MVAIYVLLNLLFLYVLPVGELAQVQGSVLDVVADRLLGPRAGDIMGVVSIVSIAASISAMVFAGPRVYYAMARDGVFFQQRRAHPSALPHAGHLDRRAVGLERPAGAVGQRQRAHHLHRLFGGAVCRRRRAGAVRAAPARAGRAAAVQGDRLPGRARPFFALASALIVANALYTDLLVPIRHGTAWGPAAAGLIVVGLGVPLYFLFTRKA